MSTIWTCLSAQLWTKGPCSFSIIYPPFWTSIIRNRFQNAASRFIWAFCSDWSDKNYPTRLRINTSLRIRKRAMLSISDGLVILSVTSASFVLWWNLRKISQHATITCTTMNSDTDLSTRGTRLGRVWRTLTRSHSFSVRISTPESSMWREKNACSRCLWCTRGRISRKPGKFSVGWEWRFRFFAFELNIVFYFFILMFFYKLLCTLFLLVIEENTTIMVSFVVFARFSSFFVRNSKKNKKKCYLNIIHNIIILQNNHSDIHYLFYSTFCPATCQTYLANHGRNSTGRPVRMSIWTVVIRNFVKASANAAISGSRVHINLSPHLVLTSTSCGQSPRQPTTIWLIRKITWIIFNSTIICCCFLNILLECSGSVDQSWVSSSLWNLESFKGIVMNIGLL